MIYLTFHEINYLLPNFDKNNYFLIYVIIAFDQHYYTLITIVILLLISLNIYSKSYFNNEFFIRK